MQPKKAANEIRICVDMRKLNQVMKCERRDFPTVEDILEELNRADQPKGEFFGYVLSAEGIEPDSI